MKWDIENDNCKIKLISTKSLEKLLVEKKRDRVNKRNSKILDIIENLQHISSTEDLTSP